MSDSSGKVRLNSWTWLFWLFGRFFVRAWLRQPAQTILTFTGIALGVAVFLAINLANESVLQQFRSTVDRVAGTTSLQVLPTNMSDMPDSVLDQLTWLWDQGANFTPVLEDMVVWAEPPYTGVQVLGVDMLADSAFRAYSIKPRAERARSPDPMLPGSAGNSGNSVSALGLFAQGHVLVGQTLADKYHLAEGQSFRVLVDDRQVALVVEGIIEPGRLGKAYGGQFILADLSVAQAMLNRPGRITRVDILAAEPKVHGLMRRFATEQEKAGLKYVHMQRPERRNQQVALMLESFQMNLTALSFVGLLVGMFLIYNATSISVIQRRSELATLRALGFNRWQILLMFGVQVALFGFLGVAMGAVMGVLMAKGALAAVSMTVETVYAGSQVSRLSFDPSYLFFIAAMGWLATMAAAAFPIAEVLQVSPAAGTRQGSFEPRVNAVLKWLGLGGVLLGLLAFWFALQPLYGTVPWFGYAAALFSVLAAALMIPYVLHYVFKWLSHHSRLVFGVEGKLAVALLQGALGRTSMAVASLMVAIAMTISLSVMIGSFRQTVVDWVNQSIQADLFIQPATRFRSHQSGAFSSQVVDLIKATDGVADVDRFFQDKIEYNNRPAFLGISDMDVFSRRGRLTMVDEAAFDDVMAMLKAKPSCLVTESFAYKHRLHAGDTVRLQFAEGPLSLPVAGVYRDYTSEHGFVIVPRRWVAARYPAMANRVTSLAVFAQPGLNSQQLRDRIEANLSGRKAMLSIQTNQALRQEVLTIFDNTFAITYALHLISIAIALLAVANTLVALVLDARRQLGLIHILGANRRQLIKMVFVQGGWLGLLGCATGLAVGFVLSALLIFVINKQSFGWTIHYRIPWLFLIETCGLVMAASVIAALLPARLAVKTYAPELVRHE
ncbi:MAG: ABC transporter permease [Cyanobacteria bacterium HKST-UBA04]|nr:ABC transporter permease [Cyanobacteria bacterium HKST-UBA04]